MRFHSGNSIVLIYYHRRNLRIGIFFELVNKRGTILSTWKFKLPGNVENCDTEYCLVPPPDIDLSRESELLLRVYIGVPIFPHTLLQYSMSPKQHLLMQTIKFPLPLKQCKICSQDRYNVLERHVCVPGCVVALWSSDHTFAFLVYTFLAADILKALSQLLCPM